MTKRSDELNEKEDKIIETSKIIRKNNDNALSLFL